MICKITKASISRIKLVFIGLFLVFSWHVQSQAGTDVDSPTKDQYDQLPRIAIAGVAIESSTFSPALTHEDAFHAKTGEAVFSYYPFLAPDSLLRKRAKWLPTLKGHALPGGTVTREAYESLLGKTLNMLSKTLPLRRTLFGYPWCHECSRFG